MANCLTETTLWASRNIRLSLLKIANALTQFLIVLFIRWLFSIVIFSSWCLMSIWIKITFCCLKLWWVGCLILRFKELWVLHLPTRIEEITLYFFLEGVAYCLSLGYVTCLVDSSITISSSIIGRSSRETCLSTCIMYGWQLFNLARFLSRTDISIYVLTESSHLRSFLLKISSTLLL